MSDTQVLDSANDLAEQGYPLPEAGPAGNLPPGSGHLAIPHYLTFSQVVNYASRTYRWAFDESLRHSQTNALALRRDPVVMDALRSRQIPVIQLPWHLEAIDDTDQGQIDAVKGLTEILNSIPRFQEYKRHLSEAVWYGRYAIQNVFRWDYTFGRRRLVVADYKPINGDKLVFRYSGQPGVLIHSGFYEGDSTYTDRGRAHFFTPEEREQLVIHKHEPEDADFTEADLGGSIHGVGIRSRIYWFWWLRSQVLAFLMDYLERVGAGGFTIYYFEAGNPESMKEVKLAAEEQWRNNSVLFPRYREGSGGPGIQRVEPSPAGAQLLESLVTGYFDNIIRRFILGQSLTSEAIGTGLGSGVADLHADTFSRIIKYDAVALEETITQDLLKVLVKYNYPGLPVPRFRFDVDKPNARSVLDAAEAFYEMGGEIDEDELRSIIGLAKPAPGSAVLAKVDSLSPAGVGAMPEGVPMEGQPGPLPGGGGGDMGGAEGEAEQPFLFAAQGAAVQTEPQQPQTFDQPDLPFPEPPALEGLEPEDRKEVHGIVAEGGLSHQDLWKYKQKDVAKFLKHRRMVNVDELVESAKAGQSKRGWYAKIHPYLKTIFPKGVDAERFTGLLAAVSPRIPVDRSLHLALDIWQEWNEAGRPSDKKVLDRLLADSTKKWKKNADLVHKERGFKRQGATWVDSKTGKQKHLPAGLVQTGDSEYVPWGGAAQFTSRTKNTVDVLSQPDDTVWENFSLSGNKVNGFFQNMLGNDRHATLDAWMANFWGIDQKLFTSKVSYQAFTSSLTSAASKLNQSGVFEKPWSVAEVQETVWSFFRALARLQGKKKVGPVQALADVTHGDVGDIVDFVKETVGNKNVQARLQRLIGGQKVGEVVKRLQQLDSQLLGQTQGSAPASGRAGDADSPVLRRVAERASQHADAFSGRVKYAASDSLTSEILDDESEHPEEHQSDWQGRVRNALQQPTSQPSAQEVPEPEFTSQQIMSHGSLGSFVDQIKSATLQGRISERGDHHFEKLWHTALGVGEWDHIGGNTHLGFDLRVKRPLVNSKGEKIEPLLDTKLLMGNRASIYLDIDSARSKFHNALELKKASGATQIPSFLVFSKKKGQTILKLGIEPFNIGRKIDSGKDMFDIPEIKSLEDLANPEKVEAAAERIRQVYDKLDLKEFKVREDERYKQLVDRANAESARVINIVKQLGMDESEILENLDEHILSQLSPDKLLLYLQEKIAQLQQHPGNT